MQLLDARHWQTQYTLSLNIYEMSASVSCMRGDIDTMSSCLDEILSHAKSFDDSLKASSLLVKLLASQSRFEEARSNCLLILSNLGEVFPQDVNLPLVLNDLSKIQILLRNVTHDQIKSLPRMADINKLNSMKFLNMLCMYSIISKPMLLPLLSCRMVRLTLQYGTCDDSIVGEYFQCRLREIEVELLLSLCNQTNLLCSYTSHPYLLIKAWLQLATQW